MKGEKLLHAIGNISDGVIQEAEPGKGSQKKRNWLKWGAAAACFSILIIAAGFSVTYLRGGLFVYRKDFTEGAEITAPLNVVSINGAYYDRLSQSDTAVLQKYALPEQIADSMVGEYIGSTHDSLYAVYSYIPRIGAKSSSAVYVLEDSTGEYTFALFCNFIHEDPDAYEKAGKLLAVYGVNSADDIADIQIDGKGLASVKEFYHALANSQAFGSDSYQQDVFENKTEEQQKSYAVTLAGEMQEIRMETKDGLISYMHYYPSTGYIAWAVNYYKLPAGPTEFTGE